MSSHDVLIIGAGAAGLAAAVGIGGAGRSVCVLEARDRVGGRIWTRHDPQLTVPIELGAEFIHGNAPSVMRWLRRANTAAMDAGRSRWSVHNGVLQPGDGVFEQMRKGLARMARPRRDLPFADFLAGAGRRLPAQVREFARMLVEGFDAADAARASTLETLEEWAGQGAADAPTFRPVGGFATLLGAMLAALDHDQVRVQLNTVVRSVQWRRGRVVIHATQSGHTVEFTAPKAIITLPLGVLQDEPPSAGAVHFDPPLKTKHAALRQLAMGPVLKIVLQFHSRFWESLNGGRYRNGTFFHAPVAAFRTFWSMLPLRAPVLTAWCAGPNAARLTALGNDELTARALGSLDEIFGSRAGAHEQLQAASLHNWQADPFARGAYSYVLAGGGAARKALARPLLDTLFFAGEAADTEGESGTVAGALQSGERAAAEVLRQHSGSRPVRSR